MNKKCDHCENEFVMHAGVNICPACGGETTVLTPESNSPQEALDKLKEEHDKSRGQV